MSKQIWFNENLQNLVRFWPFQKLFIIQEIYIPVIKLITV